VKLCFISGAYRSGTEAGVRRNIEAAREVMIQLLQAGFAVHCPHMNTAHLGGVVPDEVFLAADLEILSRCDILVTVDGWMDSAGAVGEARFARENGIPVRNSVKYAIGWLKDQGK
jgi:nucleoside 2-deoxyribosyltransferase